MKDKGQGLTEGNITKSLIIFSAPMIIGNLVQQLYNVVDTLIVSKYLGATALSAVGASSTIIILITSIILGMCMGSGVVFSQFYGAKQLEKMKMSIVNAALLIVILTSIVFAFSCMNTRNLAIWTNIPDESIEYAVEYMSIIFYGIIAVSIYNYVAAILRSVGNSVIPLIFLMISSIMNIVLDILFIIKFDSGVSGVAWATVISQIFSAICIGAYLLIKQTWICPNREHMHLEKGLLKLLATNSIFTAIQQSVMNFGILMIQSLVNSFGYLVSAAFAIVVKIDALAYMPAQDFGNAFATFVAQNYGAKKTERLYKGTKIAMLISGMYCIFISVTVFISSNYLMRFFVDASEVEIIQTGMQYLRIEGACYVGIGILFLLYGGYRGIGKAWMSIVLTVISLGTRVVIAYSISGIAEIGVVGIWIAIPIGWFLADIVGCSYFIKNHTKFIDTNMEGK